MSFHKSPNTELDPLDNEILERAFDAAWDAVKSTCQHFEAESDEELEAALRRELIEIARSNGVNDPDALKEIWLASMPSSRLPRTDAPD
jgi:frataxin-like iron-binding protein CyaY